MENNVYQLLQEWHELLLSNTITENEFETIKKSLLGNGKQESQTVKNNINEVPVQSLEEQLRRQAEYDALFNKKSWFQKNSVGVVVICLLLLISGVVVWYRKTNATDIEHLTTNKDSVSLQKENYRSTPHKESSLPSNENRLDNSELSSQVQKLFIPDSVMNNPNLNRFIKKVIETKDRKFKIDKIVRYDRSYSYSISKMGKGTIPIYSYGTKDNSYVVDDFTHWANVDVKTATEFYENCGFEEYKNNEDGNKTIRLVNEDKSIFILIQKIATSKSYISFSNVEMSDETDY